MELSVLNNQNKLSLDEEHIYFGGMNLTYQLLVSALEPYRSFCVRVIKGTEFHEVNVGTDLCRALALYQTVVKGAVTPCTLEDVLHDLQYA